MPTTRIPNPNNKKWIVSYLGDFFGNIINAFGIDLFSAQGKVKVRKKFKPLYVQGISPPSSFCRAKISDGEERKDKTWAVCDAKKILRASSNTLEFVEDESTGFFSDEDTDAGSDIISIPDDSENSKEPIITTPVATPDGEDEAIITGLGWGTKAAQSFSKIEGALTKISFGGKKVGSPTDSLKISIQGDDSGKPDGNELASVIVYPADMATSFTTIQKDLEGADFDFKKKYWMVFERTGSGSNIDFYAIKSLLTKAKEDVKDPYPDNEMILHNGSSWKPVEDVYRWITDTFTASGTWTVPAGVSEAIVEVWGAGGGGTTNVGGGGGGAYSRKTVSGLTPSQNKAVVVGVSAANTNGGDSTFDTNVVIAKGGKSGANGGQGGQASEGTGDVKFSGGNGAQGTGDKGGGGGAGDQANGGSSSGETPGMGGQSNGGVGGGKFSWYVPPNWLTSISNFGRIIGGGGRSAADAQYAGARGEVRITYRIALPDNYAAVAGRAWGRDTTIVPPLGVQPGDLLLAVVSSYGAKTISISGWTKLKELSQSTNITQSIFYKRAAIGNIGKITGGGTFPHWVVYRVVNAGIPQGTQIAETTWPADPPNHNTGKLDKYLWLAVASWQATTDEFSLLAPPSNYGSFIILPEFLWHTGSADDGARTAIAERYLEAASEDPGAFDVASGRNCVVATIAIPFDGSKYYFDATMSASVKIPAAEERLYLSTTKDIKFLDKENSKWRSLWQNILRQKPLNENYPRIIKLWGKADVLFIGNDNKISSVSKPIAGTNYGSQYVDFGRLTFSSDYFVKWIVSTKNAIFIGLENKKSPYLPSMICFYEPLSETTKLVEIPEGTTIGFAQDENCHIIDITGQIRKFTGLSFQPYDYLPTYFKGAKVPVLPHRNGFAFKGGNIHFLWEGKYPYPAGIWIYEKEMKRLYHAYSMGALEGSCRALFNVGNVGEELLAGAAILDDVLVKGIFNEGNTSPFGWFTMSKMTTGALNEKWQNLLIKYDPIRPEKTTGEIIFKYRFEPSQISEETSFDGEWTGLNTFSADLPEEVKIGDEIIIRKGKGAGRLAHITGINRNTCTIDENLGEAGKTFIFSVENWKKLEPITSNKKFSEKLSLGSKEAEWLQLKAEIRGDYDLEEIQVSHNVSTLIEEN